MVPPRVVPGLLLVVLACGDGKGGSPTCPNVYSSVGPYPLPDAKVCSPMPDCNVCRPGSLCAAGTVSGQASAGVFTDSFGPLNTICSPSCSSDQDCSTLSFLAVNTSSGVPYSTSTNKETWTCLQGRCAVALVVTGGGSLCGTGCPAGCCAVGSGGGAVCCGGAFCSGNCIGTPCC